MPLPVSYTHLDVYKRQDLHESFGERSLIKNLVFYIRNTITNDEKSQYEKYIFEYFYSICFLFEYIIVYCFLYASIFSFSLFLFLYFHYLFHKRRFPIEEQKKSPESVQGIESGDGGIRTLVPG